MKKFKKNLIVATIAALCISLGLVVIGFTGKVTALAATAVNLGTAADFAVLAYSGIN